MNTKIKELLGLFSFAGDTLSFPGTVCDAFSALHAIASYDKNLLEGRPLGKITALLVSLESVPGGPYYSAPAAKGGQKICDRRTNLAIARFLSVYEVKLPNLDTFLGKKKSKASSRARKGNISGHPGFTMTERDMMNKIRMRTRTRLAWLDPGFRKLAEKAIEQTIRGNPDKQMSLMPYYLKIALGKKGKKIPDEMLASMGMANIFFWTAFIIYDNFWDEDEAADPRLLPAANLFARSYVEFFGSALPPRARFSEFFHRLMDKLDAANAWETRCCRARTENAIFEIPDSLPDYGGYEKKYLPASGHVAGPVALLSYLGYGIDSAESKYCIEYFKHYLIAMQMNDDMHDWEEDLRRGHISTAVDILLRDLPPGRKTINLEKDMEELRRMFWFVTLPKIAEKALRHLRKSRAALMSMRSIENPAPLLYFIDFNQKIAEKALTEQKHSVQFLNGCRAPGN
jgi:hypothetical protein